ADTKEACKVVCCEDLEGINIVGWAHTAMVGETVCLLESLDPLESATLKMTTVFSKSFTLPDLAASICSRWAGSTRFDTLRLFRAVQNLTLRGIIIPQAQPRKHLDVQPDSKDTKVTDSTRELQRYEMNNVLIRKVGGAMLLEAQKKVVKRQALIDRALARDLPARMEEVQLKKLEPHIPWLGPWIALHSIQAASIAEQHSRALRELLARTLSSAELQARAASVAGLSSSLASTLSAPGPTSPLLVPLSGDGLLESPRSPSSASPEPGRWWEVLGVPANNVTIASRAGGAPQRPQDQKCLSAQTLQESLDAAELRCTTGALDEEDQRALRTMVEWRYGQALASGLREEELLTDSHAVQLASWHAPEGQEASASLPAELLDAAQRCGGSLTATLDAAFREPEDLQE
ncbi:unnamed protein product, partial [Polarella glacialis]